MVSHIDIDIFCAFNDTVSLHQDFFLKMATEKLAIVRSAMIKEMYRRICYTYRNESISSKWNIPFQGLGRKKDRALNIS
jgi:hypothetical protein